MINQNIYKKKKKTFISDEKHFFCSFLQYVNFNVITPLLHF